MNNSKLKSLLLHPENLPEYAFCLMPSDRREVIIVKNGDTGYYPYQAYASEDIARATCEYANSQRDISEEAAEALLILSLRQVTV